MSPQQVPRRVRLQAHALQQLYRPVTRLRLRKQVWLGTRPIAPPTTLHVPTRHGEVALRIHRPNPASPLSAARPGESGLPPVHLQLHGGAFIIRSVRQDDHLAAYLASEVGCVVVNVDYATAPQAAYPVAEEQCFDVATWLAEHGEEYGWDGTRMSVGGFSAGGKLAINVCQQAYAAGGPDLRALVLGCAVADVTRADRTSAKPRALISPALQRLVRDAYFPDAVRRGEPLASPLFDADLAKALPPTLITTGDLDTLGAEMDQLAERLTGEGVEVVHHRFAGTDHAFTHGEGDPLRVHLELTRDLLLRTLR